MNRQKLRKKREGKIHRKETIMVEKQNLSGAMELMQVGTVAVFSLRL